MEAIRMKMTRRQFAASLASPALTQASGQEVRIANSLIRQILRFQSGSLLCVSLKNLQTGREWIHPDLPSEEFLVDAGAQISGKGPLEWGGAESRDEGSWRVTEITLRHAACGLTITRRYLCHAHLPVIRQQTLVRNDGTSAVVIRRADAFRLRVAPVSDALELYWIDNFGRAMLPEPGNPIHRASVDDNIEMQVRSGPYSPHCGWFALAIPGQAEGLAGGWEWSGPVAVSFGDRRDPCLIHGGLDPDRLAEPAAPGASFQLPGVWCGFYSGGLDDAARLSQRLVEELAPPKPETDWPWVGYCTWAASIDQNSPYNAGAHPWFPTEENILSQAEAAASLGCELFLWDYGWFPRVGDWWCDPRRFRRGPGPVVRAVKNLGMKLGLWVGFGNADDDAEVVRKHPDWLATYNGKPIPDSFFTRTAASTWKTRTLCLAHEPARRWVKEQLARIIDAFQLDWLKHDFDLITYCQDSSHTHTPGDGRYAACQGFYEIMDFVRARWPRLVSENWMNNSAVPDYGVIQRHHVQLIGDAYQPFQLRQMFYGHSQIYPPDRQHRYLSLEPGKGAFRAQVRSGSLGGPWTLLTDPRRLAVGQLAELKEEIALYKRIRPLFKGAEVYRLLGRPHPRAWDAIQFHNPHLGQGVVYVFRGRHPDAQCRVPLARGKVFHAREALSGKAAPTEGRYLVAVISEPESSRVYLYSSRS
jgi:hypothetical protein